jgi:hypothetical protein
MDPKKLLYLKQLLKKREELLLGVPYNLLIHSILNTIDLEELIRFYLPMTNSDLKKSIESNIIKRKLHRDNKTYSCGSWKKLYNGEV